MQISTYIISALLSNFVFSVATFFFIFSYMVKAGVDGSPGIMLFVLMFNCAILSIVTATIMGIAKAKYQKEFPAKFSAIIFVFTYFPVHIIELYFSDKQLDSLSIPLWDWAGYMMFFSYIPFFHMTTQGLINLNEFVKRQELAGNRSPKFFVWASFGAIILFACWLIYKP